MLRARSLAYCCLALLLTGVLLASCGYRFTADSSTRLPAGHKVWVAYFQNNTVYPAAPVVLKRALFDQFAALRGIGPAAGPAEGDLLVEGILTSYGSDNASHTAMDVVREYRLVLSAEITVRRKGEVKPLWKGPVSAWQDYPTAATIELQRSNEDTALLEASRKLAQQVIWNLEQNY